MGEENIIKDKTETKGMSNQKKILSLKHTSDFNKTTDFWSVVL